MTAAVVFVDKKAAAHHDPIGHPAIVVKRDGAAPPDWERYHRVEIDGPASIVQHGSYVEGVQVTVVIRCDADHIITP